MHIDDQTYARFLSALLGGDRRLCRTISDAVGSSLPLKGLYEDLFKRALYDIGDLWERNRISVAEEHMATAIIEGLLNERFPDLVSTIRKQRRVIIASIAGELHQVGGKMVSDIFEMHGWDAHYLGADMPVNELIQYAREIQPDLIGLSLSIYFNIPILLQIASQLQQEFQNTGIIVGGQAFRHGGLDAVNNREGVTFIRTLDELEAHIQTL